MAEKPMRCYRTACNNAAHPCGYNRVTHGLYCLDCARNINTGGHNIDKMPGLMTQLAARFNTIWPVNYQRR